MQNRHYWNPSETTFLLHYVSLGLRDEDIQTLLECHGLRDATMHLRPRTVTAVKARRIKLLGDLGITTGRLTFREAIDQEITKYPGFKHPSVTYLTEFDLLILRPGNFPTATEQELSWLTCRVSIVPLSVEI